MPPEPFAGEASDFFECPVLFEEMRCSRYDSKLLLAPPSARGCAPQACIRYRHLPCDSALRNLCAWFTRPSPSLL